MFASVLLHMEVGPDGLGDLRRLAIVLKMQKAQESFFRAAGSVDD